VLKYLILLVRLRDLWIKGAKKLGECLINMSGGSIDTEGLTAVAGDVVSPKKFYGSGSEEIQQGTIPDKGELNHYMTINETYKIPAGFYSGGSVRQSIPVLGEQRVTPTSKTITLQTTDKYMGGNIILSPIANLRPENIKKGEYVGGVGPGTWEGYIVTNPNTFYYKGTFAPGQGITAFKFSYSSYVNEPQYGKKDMTFWGNSDSRENRYCLMFNLPIDITTKNKLTISGKISNDYSTIERASMKISGYTQTISSSNTESDLNDNNKIFSTSRTMKADPNGEYSYVNEVDLSTYSREIYLYLIIAVQIDQLYVTIDSIEFT